MLAAGNISLQLLYVTSCIRTVTIGDTVVVVLSTLLEGATSEVDNLLLPWVAGAYLLIIPETM
jgi:hypothetical protein